MRNITQLCSLAQSSENAFIKLSEGGTVVGAKFIAPPSPTTPHTRERIGWASGRNEFGPYNSAGAQNNFSNSITELISYGR